MSLSIPANSPTPTAAGTALPARPGAVSVTGIVPATRLRRVRWGVRAVLTVGVAASVAANILHADPHPVSQVIAAWPPLALLLTVELISRVPVHRRSLAAVRLLATAAIAGIAAWVSYFHMVGVVSRYGETGTVPYLLPLSVDGLVVVASISLVELAGRIHDIEKLGGGPMPPAGDSGPPTTLQSAAEPSSPAETGEDLTARRPPQMAQIVEQRHPSDSNAGAADDATEPAYTVNGVSGGVDEPSPVPARSRASGRTNTAGATAKAPTFPPSHTDVNAEGQTAHEQPHRRHPAEPASDAVAGGAATALRPDDDDDMPATAAAIAAVLRSDPTLQPADVAVKINKSVRTVRRHWKTAEARPALTRAPTRTRDDQLPQEDVNGDSAARRR